MPGFGKDVKPMERSCIVGRNVYVGTTFLGNALTLTSAAEDVHSVPWETSSEEEVCRQEIAWGSTLRSRTYWQRSEKSRISQREMTCHGVVAEPSLSHPEL